MNNPSMLGTIERNSCVRFRGIDECPALFLARQDLESSGLLLSDEYCPFRSIRRNLIDTKAVSSSRLSFCNSERNQPSEQSRELPVKNEPAQAIKLTRFWLQFHLIVSEDIAIKLN
ncbi:hypothetical protein MITS9509_03463 [Synechococcus sp. MIT S9509]|nr:hypothetical protein MITS9504_03497 [Synechococcus sp. MIT S9504]KZR86492.1 hypothetical protein MITS9509_03463 [Synechococcus sp. MIT S9509]